MIGVQCIAIHEYSRLNQWIFYMYFIVYSINQNFFSYSKWFIFSFIFLVTESRRLLAPILKL